MAKKGGKPNNEMEPIEIPTKRDLSQIERDTLINTLHERFEGNMERHQNMKWDEIKERLEGQPNKLWSVFLMEQTGGEPDVIEYDEEEDQFIICDCSAQSPADRRKITYDQKGLEIRHKKGVYPPGSAVGLAEEMGLELLDERQYRKLQELGEFDTKTSSWIVTPKKIRKLGGALFCDRRYDTVFVYHNGADSFYSARGFRGMVRF